MHPFKALFLAGIAPLCGCGGGGSAPSPGAPAQGTVGGEWVIGRYLDAETFAGLCATPRTGVDPHTGFPYQDRPGTSTDENNWLRSWSNDLYLWYDQIIDRNPADYSTEEYFDLLKTSEDRFHFTVPTQQWQSYAQSGIEVGYGVHWSLIEPWPPRLARVAFVEPGSPAAEAGLTRGDRLLQVDGVDFLHANERADIDRINEGLFPTRAGSGHSFRIGGEQGQNARTVQLTAVPVEWTPVPEVLTIDTLSGPVGYLLFNTHIATAERALVDAVRTLEEAGVVDLVLDLRYNGGGYLVIASQLAYMIAGDVPTAGRAFETMVFNDKHPSTNPVTGEPLTPMGFQTETVFSGTPEALPTLDLPRVFVITGDDTCSASESIINSLRGVDVEVLQIGSRTCGKPFGFYPADNCGTTYFSIQFKGVNAKGFGDYTSGFAPAALSGCAVADDFDHRPGDIQEARLAAALEYRASRACPVPDAGAASVTSKPVAHSATEGRLLRPPWLENRILRR